MIGGYLQAPISQWIDPEGPLTDEHVTLAKAIVEAGFHFAAQAMINGQVFFTVSDGEYDLASRQSSNGPEVLDAIVALIISKTPAQLVEAQAENRRIDDNPEADAREEDRYGEPPISAAQIGEE